MSSRKANDIPFPSFSLVIDQYSMSNMRLPSYRASYLLRFHPYPRVKLSQREIMVSDATNIISALFLTLVAKHAVNDRPSSLYDIVENDDSVGPVILNFVRVFFCHFVVLFNSPMQPDLPEEQHPNAENPQEAIEVAETDAQPHVKHLNFTTLIIVRLLAYSSCSPSHVTSAGPCDTSCEEAILENQVVCHSCTIY